MTPEQEKTYLENKGRYCPFCYSEDIEASEIEVDFGYARQEVCCNTCYEIWTDQFTLASATGTEADGDS